MAEHLLRSGAGGFGLDRAQGVLIADGWSEQAVEAVGADALTYARDRKFSNDVFNRPRPVRKDPVSFPKPAVLLLAAMLCGVGGARLVTKAANKATWDVMHAQQMEASLWWK